MNYFYFDQNNQKFGPVNEEQLRELATQRVIGLHTPMETDTGHKGVAGQIPGLFPATSSSPFAQTAQAVSSASSKQLFCTNCGNPVSEQAVACMSCGARPTGHKKFCRHCGTGLNPEQIICIKCGAGVNATATTQFVSVRTAGSAPKSKIVAAIFAFFLGAFGAHKYYMGSWGWGIVFCVFTVLTLFYGGIITGFIALIEGIIYLTDSDEVFAKKYPPETRAPFRW